MARQGIPYEVLAAAALIIISFAIAAYFYPILPEEVASHWNAAGEVDGYMPKAWGLFLMPVLSAFLLALFMLIPRIDPLGANIEKFRRYYNGFVLLMTAFLFCLFLLTVVWNLGVRVSIIAFLSPAFAALFFYCGILMENSKRNWFVGIRTPWTISDDMVWDKTNRLGGKLFKLAGAISLFGIVFQGQAILFVIVPILIFSIYTTLYSYFEYQKVKKVKVSKVKIKRK